MIHMTKAVARVAKWGHNEGTWMRRDGWGSHFETSYPGDIPTDPTGHGFHGFPKRLHACDFILGGTKIPVAYAP